MNQIGLSPVDWLIIAVYFYFIIGIGFYLKRFTKSEDDFFPGGKKEQFLGCRPYFPIG
ncbi:MAG: hypothetical protein ACYCVH_05135 [Ignavibacteriaceae bacterium]